ncbi:class III lanthionine synthetase LanKC [Labedaea rhizosphaerae]|uniref:non-specific serine/threonine protein kinase n=1 Tax=Labedaea rhizosphaerae TaxID=598644 RepID=A0A4R6RUI6_LABRH|nr:class III lanthionine synthetase LanKC [Labedaea rhizosphaerae]TDP90017.1 protein kinase-like protein [Labedaea rhizosphaerae]
MDPQLYEMFCRADATFFDTPERIADDDGRFDLDLPAQGWHRRRRGVWVACAPDDVRLPEQGWKIHVSTTPAAARRVLDVVSGYCVAAGVAFKHLRSQETLRLFNGKQAPRASSGKFVTIYPVDDAAFERVVTDLAELLAGTPGPYILSDLRIGDGPLYVRYGGFAPLYCADEELGEVPALRHPDGVLVPDRREPVFRTPDWVTPPEFLRPHLAARATGAEFPYKIERALHFSNGGGIYAGTQAETGRAVVLREARPHAGLDRDGVDAVARLENERAVLARLAGLDCVPSLIDVHDVSGHRFLVQEFIEGKTLFDEAIARYPLVRAEPSPDTIAEYTRWATGVLDRVAAALDAVHARGIRYGDLHPANVIVRPDGRVVLVDFEIAGDAADESAPALGAPGFAAPQGVRGLAADAHALAVLRLFLFLPLVAMLPLHPAKAVTLTAIAAQDFPVPQRLPATTADRAAALFDEPHWPALRDALVAGIHASATLDRDDRLFPGDPDQFGPAALGLAHGPAGVLYALHAAGCTVPGEYVDWLIDAADRAERPGVGLYDGLLGVALVLDLLGRADAAERLLDKVMAATGRVTGLGLFGGAAGIGLGLLHFSGVVGAEPALRIAGQLAGLPSLPTRVGLLHGAGGLALLHLAVFEETGDERQLDAAGRALAADLGQGQLFADGSFHLRNGFRNMSYLDGGSGGVALVLGSYLRHRPSTELAATLAAIRHGLRVPHIQQPQLFRGRAGVIAILAELGGDRPTVDAQIRRLGRHAIPLGDGISFPGNQLLRLSTDLATGSAGVLLALAAAHAPRGPVLPLLRPQAQPVGSVEGR